MDLQIWDAASGIGKIESVFNALEVMSLTTKEDALLFLTIARHSSCQVSV